MDFAQHSWTILMVLVGLNGGLALHEARIAREFQFHALNVGQGDALLLVTPDQHHVLIDGGPGSSVVEELGEVLPFFFRDVDLMVVTHPHLDHIEGLISVLEHHRVKEILMSAPDYENEAYEVFLDEVVRQGIPVHFAQADKDFKLGDLNLDVLYPFEPVTGRHFENVNNVSVVIDATYGGHSFLLMGDAEQEVEAQLLEAGVVPTTHVLKAGHHGSRSSSIQAFLEAASPSFMVISCGKANQFGHPHLETLQKAAVLNVEVFRTDLEGRVSLTFQELSWIRSIFAPRLRSLASSPS